MAQYAVPPQYADFVSSKEELLRELESGSGGFTTDHILYSVYPDAPLTAEQALYLFERVYQALAQIGSGYLWHRDGFDLHMIVPDPSTSDTSIYFHGCMEVGDCIEDEWFVVYMLQTLSSELPGLSIKVWDSDGHFLLIEAADVLPSWVGPENAENRLWIRGGALHLIPPDEGGRDAHGGLLLPAALAVLRDAGNGCLCPEVLHCVDRRTRAVYPNMTDALKHTTAALLPRGIAHLLQSQPRLLADIVAVLCSGDKSAKKTMAAMARLGPLLRAEDTVLVEITTTKTSYAKMSFQQLHPPKKFHSLRTRLLCLEGGDSLLVAAGVDRASSGAALRAFTKAFDLGCKLTCALEAAYHISRAAAGRAATTLVEAEASCELASQRLGLGLLTGDALAALQRLRSARLLAASASAPSRSGSFTLPRNGTLPSVCELVDRMLGDLFQCQATMVGMAPRLLVEGRVGQSDEWLHMSPEAFDREIARVMGGMGMGGQPPGSGGGSSGAGSGGSGGGSLEEEELRRLEGVVQSLGGFLSSESGLGGATGPRRADDMGGYFSEEEEGEEEEEGSDEEGDRGRAAPAEHFVGYRKACLPHAAPSSQQVQPPDSDDEGEEEGRAREEEEEGRDSDDEVEGGDGGFMDEYHDVMEAQLGGSTLSQSFERYAGDAGGGVDVETNLVKSLLESRAGESGGAGPASLLLGQLGVQLPEALRR